VVGVASLQSQSDPSLRPGLVGILGYLSGTLILAGGLTQGTVAYSSSLVLWGLTGPVLVWLGVIGIFTGFTVVGLAAFAAYRPTPGAGRGVAIIVLALLGLFTSLLGFFFVATVLGLFFGVLVLRQGSRLRNQAESPARPAESLDAQPSNPPVSEAAGASPVARSGGNKHHTYVVFFLLGGGYVVLGVVSWILNRTALDLLLVGIGGFVLLIGVGFHLAVTRFFPGSAG
jgi:hypothetical protein